MAHNPAIPPPGRVMTATAPTKRRANPERIYWVCHLLVHRLGLGLTQRQMAERCGVPHVTIGRAEAGMGVTLVVGLRIARFLGIPVECLWEEIDGESYLAYAAERAGAALGDAVAVPPADSRRLPKSSRRP